MKKLYTIRYIAMIMMTMMTSVISAQFVCYNGLTFSLNPVGEFVLFPSDLLAEGDLSGLDATLSQMLFTCDDIGTNEVVLDIYDGADLIFSCTSLVVVEDQINPNVLCIADPEVVLNASGEYVFGYQDIVESVLEECSIAQYVIAPISVQCGDPNPLPVTVTVFDQGGNSASCTTDVSWSDFPDPVQNLACNDQINISVLEGDEAEVTADMILEGGPYACPAHYEVVISENMVPRPEPIVTIDDTNKILIAEVTDPSTNTSCWGQIWVNGFPNCTDPFVVCDTMCRSTELGDCASGHTDEDNVEWPCDINIEVECNVDVIDPTPSYLLNHNLAELEDTYPQIINDVCFLLGITYADQIFLDENEKTILREWTVVDWQTMSHYTYTQTITIASPGVIICDTLPWNAPVGDCDSGHTLDDAVEWPADITVSTVFVSPDDLVQNPDVVIQDTRPNLVDSCELLVTNYTDQYIVLNDTTVRVIRTWVVLDWSTASIWEYNQKIKIENINGSSVVCITREDGEPIPGVTLAPGIETDDSGCYSFPDPTGMTITPVKDAPLQEGVNLLDKVLMMEGVLGITQLSFYQNKAADLSQNDIVSTLDIYYLDQILDGTFVPPFDHNWMFYEQNTHQQSVDISNPLLPYHFIGVKMGDLDNSAPLSGAVGLDPIGLLCDDEILNKKEHYEISFELSEDTRVQGFTLRLENPGQNLNISAVHAAALPGFNASEHVVVEAGAITINYIAPEEYLAYGIALPSGSTLFTLSFSPVINTFLSQELVLSSTRENILRSLGNEKGNEFTLDWENVIISSVIGVDEGQPLEFFPNPVINEIRFKGLQDNQRGMISVIDALGRVHYQSSLATEADLSTLATGMYYLHIQLENGRMYTAPLMKM